LGREHPMGFTAAEGFPVHTSVSTLLLLLRDSDPFLTIYITEITELRWGL
jgi:hypothetical protein